MNSFSSSLQLDGSFQRDTLYIWELVREKVSNGKHLLKIQVNSNQHEAGDTSNRKGKGKDSYSIW